jgi:hypothetical protein
MSFVEWLTYGVWRIVGLHQLASLALISGIGSEFVIERILDTGSFRFPGRISRQKETFNVGIYAVRFAGAVSR